MDKPNEEDCLAPNELDISVITPLVINSEEEKGALGNSLTNRIVSKLRADVYIIAAALLATAGGVLFGYDLGIISGAILQLRDEFCFGLVEMEVVVSSLIAGAIVGSLTGGFLVDSVGRKLSIILDAAIFTVGGLVLILSEDVYMLVVGRLIVGYAVSLSATAECVYVSEIAPTHRRGMLVSLNEFGISLGILIAYIVNFIFFNVPEGWRYMFGLSVIPALFQGFGMLLLPKTPRYLLLKGREEAALKTLQKIRRDTDVINEFNEMKAAITVERRYHWWDLFRLRDHMLHRLLIGCMVVLFQQLSGQNSLLYYAPTLFKLLGFSSRIAATLATVGVGLVKFLCSIFNLYSLDKFGRRPLLLIGISILAFSMLLLGSLSIAFVDPHLLLSSTSQARECNNYTIGSQSEYTFPANTTLTSSLTATKWMSLILLMAYIGAYEISFGSISWLLLTELFPPSVRGQAVSLSTTVNWSMNLIISVTLLSVYHALLGYTYIIYGLFCVLGLVCVFLMVPETKGKSLEKISDELKFRKLFTFIQK